jgi:hypothetical protein
MTKISVRQLCCSSYTSRRTVISLISLKIGRYWKCSLRFSHPYMLLHFFERLLIHLVYKIKDFGELLIKSFHRLWYVTSAQANGQIAIILFYPPIYLHLIFAILRVETLSLMNWIFFSLNWMFLPAAVFIKLNNSNWRIAKIECR